MAEDIEKDESKHLIRKMMNRPRPEILSDLSGARAFLAAQGKIALLQASQIDSDSAWGSSSKRVRVMLPQQDRPASINEGIASHSLIEVMNQSATLDRLIDAISWSIVHLPDYDHVLICNPTTSSSKQAVEGDNDLILSRSDGHKCRFEVSDVASEKDGNGKEEKDLVSPGALAAGKKLEKLQVVWPGDRLFLEVSSEFAAGIQGRSRTWKTHIKYVARVASPTTVVLEVTKFSVVQ